MPSPPPPSPPPPWRRGDIPSTASKVSLLTNRLGKVSWNPTTRLAGGRGSGGQGAPGGSGGHAEAPPQPEPCTQRAGNAESSRRRRNGIGWFLKIAPWESVRVMEAQCSGPLSPDPQGDCLAPTRTPASLPAALSLDLLPCGCGRSQAHLSRSSCGRQGGPTGWQGLGPRPGPSTYTRRGVCWEDPGLGGWTDAGSDSSPAV